MISQLCFLIPILSITFSFSLQATAADDDAAIKLLKSHSAKPDAYAGQISMNGYSMKDFENFYNKWKLVTVRYREDTKEMRFTYANEIAAKALDAKVKDYPEGAVFAKIGFISEADPAFQSSVVPAGAKRYQFMVRDKKKFAATDGWGYVLLNGDGKTFNGEPQQNSLACAACHKIVPDRGYIFSEQAAFAPFVEKIQKAAKEQLKIAQQHIQFKTIDRKDLSERLQRLIPENFVKIRLMQGALQQNMFEGTVNEIGPFLTQESLKSKGAAVLVNQAGDLFAFAYPQVKQVGCAKNETKSVVGRTITPATKPQTNTDEVIVKVVSYCAKAE